MAEAFQELEQRFMQTQDMHRRVAQSERQAMITKQRCELVMTELKSLPENTPTYKQIGRAYFMEPRAAVLKSCEEDIASSSSQAEASKLKREKLEEQLEGTRKELQEIAMAR
ncbi:hypothetical protein FOA52_011215 [Chlamydomonas sp. UWO 241]|nr:hypothetical protein FOA52_011215 [Chlamydomonas sp. UWO 241]